MIVISSNEQERSTDEVMDWIGNNESLLRVNREDRVNHVFVSGDELSLSIKKNYSNYTQELHFNDIKSFWYRRGDFHHNFKPHENYKIINYNGKGLEGILNDEWNVISRFIHYNLNKSKHSLGSYFTNSVNKLIMLDKARDAGLDIPNYLVSNDSLAVGEKVKNYDCITKALFESLMIRDEHSALGTYTTKISEEDIHDNESFFPSLIQEEIKKEFELRIFYIGEKIYPMAIFSQSDSKTNVDFRRYNLQKPNRNVPYKLPPRLKKNILNFIKSISINCGSIDMVKSKDHKYYFLEINPVGMFGMVSKPCNYYLEKEVARFLIKRRSK